MQVASALDDTNPRSYICQTERVLAFGVIQSYADLGEIGLIYASNLPEAPLLMATQRFLRRRLLDKDMALVSTIYGDILALWAAFKYIISEKQVWLVQLLFYPVLSEQRAKIQKQLPGLLILDGAFQKIGVAISVQKRRSAGLAYVKAFMDGAKSDGTVREAFATSGPQQLAVAP